MLKEFLHYIEEKKLFTKDDKLLLAVSGGCDSVVLMHLCKQAGFSISIAHCNYRLRGNDSDADEYFVKHLAQLSDIPVFVEHFETEVVAENEKTSVQETARNLRYRWFQQLAKKHNFSAILTAHHLNDSIETIFLNITRGSGIGGLKGIREKNRNISRPLLFATRSQIREYAASQNLIWREDQSNFENKYSRNKIRNQVIPVLKEINPSLEKTFSVVIQHFHQADSIVNKYIKNEIPKLIISENAAGTVVDKNQLLAQQFPQLMLHFLLTKFNFNTTDTIQNLLSGINNTGNIFYSRTHAILVDRNELFILPLPLSETIEPALILRGETTVVSGKFKFEICALKYSDQTIPDDVSTAWFDLDKLIFPLVLRGWETADKFVPLGMSGIKKVSDFFIDKKIPVHLKKQARILQSGADIVWLAPYRIDNRYKITKDTKNVFEIKMTANL